MKRIVKRGEPAGLRNWRLAGQAAPATLGYNNIPSRALSELRAVLLREQGYLCAYTMLRVKDEASGHIEHVDAQSQASEKSFDYGNLVYCYPGDRALRCAFGAHRKDDAQVSRQSFVSPLDPDCETRFVYDRSGRILPRNPADSVATNTIDLMLRLNDDDLRTQRRSAIEALPIFAHSIRKLSASDAEKEVKSLDRADSKGRYRPFAPALKQFLVRYAAQRAARERALQVQSRSDRNNN